jgi:hypothetical protein
MKHHTPRNRKLTVSISAIRRVRPLFTGLVLEDCCIITFVLAFLAITLRIAICVALNRKAAMLQ